MKRFVFTLLLAFCVFSTFAQQVIPLSKEAVKELKERYKKEVEGKISTIEQVVDDDFTCYFLKHKNGNTLAVLDKDRNIIIKYGKYGADVKYIPARRASYVWINDSFGKEYWPVPASEAVFLVTDISKSSIHKIDGTPIMEMEFPEILRPHPYGASDDYYYLEKEIFNSDDYKSNLYGIYTVDGEEVVPLGRYNITKLYEYGYKNDKINGQYHLIRFFQTKKTIDGVDYFGAYPITEEDIEKYGVIPTEYMHIGFDYKGNLKVKKTPVDEEEEYVKNSNYTAKDRDEGEHYYKLKNYDKVIEYYSTYKDIKPWAVFYSGMAFFEKAKQIKNTISGAHFVIYDRPDLRIYGGIKEFKDGPSDINLMREFYIKAHQLLGYYIDSKDAEFQKQADTYFTLSRYYSDVNDEDYNKTLTQYNKVVSWINQQDAAERAERERRQQQQAAFWGAILQGFANGMCQAINTAMTSSSTASARHSATGFQYDPSQATATPSSSESSDNSSSSSSAGSSYEIIGSVTALKICTGYGVNSAVSESIELYKYKVTGNVHVKIGGKYHPIHDNNHSDFLEHNVSSYRKAVSSGSCTYFFNM